MHLLRFEMWNLKDFCFACANEWSNFKSHKDIQLTNSNESYSLNMSIFRDTAHAQGNVSCFKINIDREFHSNSPMNELGFLDVFLENSGFCLTKKGKFIGSVDDMARCTMGLQC